MRALHRRALHRRGACPRRRARFTLAPLSSSRSPPLPLLSRPRKNRQNVSKPIYPVRETRLASFSPLVVSAHSRENASQQRFPTLPHPSAPILRHLPETINIRRGTRTRLRKDSLKEIFPQSYAY